MTGVADFLGLTFEQVILSEQLRDIKIPEMEYIGDQGYLSFRSRGLSLVFMSSGIVGVVNIHSQGDGEYNGYVKDLPGDLSFNMSRADVRKLLGLPKKSGEIQDIPILGLQPSWDGFYIEGFAMYVRYSFEENSIERIVITD